MSTRSPSSLCVTALLATLASPSAFADAGADAGADAAPNPSVFFHHHGLIAAIDHAEGETLYIYDLSTDALRRLSEEIDCHTPQLSLDGTRVVYQRAGMLYLRALSGGRAEHLVAGYDGHFLRDAAGEEWIYYTTVGDDPTDTSRRLQWPEGRGITTRRVRLRDRKDEHVLDWKGSGGPSPDGTHIVAGYATVALFGAEGDPHLLNGGEQGCNTSLSPDDRYLVMFFPALDHSRIAVVDKDDQLHWEITAPLGVVRWDNPDWSNHPRYAVASAVAAHGSASVFLFELPEVFDGGQRETRWIDVMTIRHGRHDWREPTLWVEWSLPISKDAGPPDALVPDATRRDASADASSGNASPRRVASCDVGAGAFEGLGPMLLVALLFAFARRQRAPS